MIIYWDNKGDTTFPSLSLEEAQRQPRFPVPDCLYRLLPESNPLQSANHTSGRQFKILMWFETWGRPFTTSCSSRNVDGWLCILAHFGVPDVNLPTSMNSCVGPKIYVWFMGKRKLFLSASGFVIGPIILYHSLCIALGNRYSTEGNLKSFNSKASHCQKITTKQQQS